MGVLITVLVVCAAAGLVLLAMSLRNVQQYEKGVVFRFGRLLPDIRGPGLRVIRPIGDRMQKVSVQTEVLGIPPQGSITADNVTLTVDAVVYFKVIDPVKALVNVRNYPSAVSQIAQTSLRAVIGRADLDTLLSDRDHINAELKKVMDAPTEEPWGLRIERVEIKDIALPESMMRSMSKQAEAERERRARVIAADGEFQASQRLSDAAATMADTPGALQLRLLQTVVDVSAEKNSTLVMPFPVEMLRFFEHQSRETDGESARHRRTTADPLPALPELPELTIPAPPTAPAFSLSGERVGSGGERIGSRTAVARERRDNWPARADSDFGASDDGG
ncbi:MULTISPECIES: SPFH domain-containing protein [unclassified Streptomyces]|uniref:slipin family protein n=1 Tax=unclassified Streptomyces TaxID=2593676 RepID=UPI002E81B8E1|nr:SPFH domain-containing protein [Streptomyces sp. NBC_00589]WTI37383.1 SPFH domain-containing protein [Streptomyces sp. NBC_00775]WUB28940.1 SPFH domain-containing protein [Streptomyces sp. NBC_00589]